MQLSFARLTEWVETHRRQSLAIALSGVIGIAWLDWKIKPNVTLGALYVFPLLLASIFLPRLQIAFLASICAVLRECFSPFHWQPQYDARILLTFGAFTGFGMLVSEMNRNRRLTLERARQEQTHLLFQREADSQLRTLVEASPLSIFVTDAGGSILLANDTGRALLEIEGDKSNILDHIPALRAVFEDVRECEARLKLDIEAAGTRASGESFFAHLWLTVYRTTVELLSGSEGSGLRIAIVLWDASEELCGREIAQAQLLDTAARVLAASFCHEIKSFCSAASALWARISPQCDSQSDADMRGLSGILHGLSEFASTGLKAGSTADRPVADLSAFADEAHIAVQAILEGAGQRLIWSLPRRLPLVYADETALIQVLLNLASNSVRAMAGLKEGEVVVDAIRESGTVEIRFCDNGPGVAAPDRLFKPFSSGFNGTGLGLYVSRALLRACGGDLCYEPRSTGACFLIQLPCVTEVRHADSAAAG